MFDLDEFLPPFLSKNTKFTMTLEFDGSKRQCRKNLELVNATLDTLKLSQIEIKAVDDYIMTQQTFDKGKLASTNYDYGFDKIQLICTQKCDEDLHIFQMDVAAFSKENLNGPKEFVAQWLKEHPNRSLRQMTKLSMKNNLAFILFHTDKEEKKKIEEEKEEKEKIEEEKRKEEDEKKKIEEEKKKEEEENRKIEEEKRKIEEEKRKIEEEKRKIEEEKKKIEEEKEKIEKEEEKRKKEKEEEEKKKKKEDEINSIAIDLCKHVCENTSDFSKKSTAFGIIGYAHRALNNLDEAIKAFEVAQKENNDPKIKEALNETVKLKEKREAEAYINPEIAETENLKANELYKAQNYQEALKVYEEAIKRNPKMPKYYTNKAQCYIKLLEFDLAIKDCESAIKIDPKTIKAYQKKANCHFIIKEYYKALQTIEDGMKYFPDDQELNEIREKAILILHNIS